MGEEGQRRKESGGRLGEKGEKEKREKNEEEEERGGRGRTEGRELFQFDHHDYTSVYSEFDFRLDLVPH
jgi:hypothetical protein